MTSNDENDSTEAVSKPGSRLIPFGIYMFLIFPSATGYAFIFIQYIRKGTLRKQIRSHNILLITICSFIQVTGELPIVLSYLYNHVSPSQSTTFCRFWAYLDYSLNVIILFLMAHTAVERYILVFHQHFLNRHLILLHYLPMVACIIYPAVLYFYLIFLYPCTNQFDYTMMTCGGPCYFYQAIISITEQFVNLVSPVLISSFGCLILLVRVLHQKQRMNQQELWRKNRRLLIQLLYVVVLYNLLWLPMVTCSSIMLFSTAPQPILLALTINILPYGIYVVILLCPFASLLSLPELWKYLIPRIHPVRIQTNSVRNGPQPLTNNMHGHKSSNVAFVLKD